MSADIDRPTDAEIKTAGDDDLHQWAMLIQENLAECGPRSSYAHRNKPILRKITTELRRRGLT